MLVCLLIFASAVCHILAEQGDVLFFAPCAGKADAAVAAGASNPRTAKGLTFGPGKRGTAVRITDKQPLAFAFAKNVISDEGTILMWIKPEWSSEDAVFHHLFYSGTGNHGGKFLNAIVLYKYIRRNRLMLYTSNGQPTIPAEGRTLCFKEPANIKKDEWLHLAVTWSATLAATEMSLFMNGKRETSARGAVFVPEESPESFRLGGPNGTGATWFDDVLIFSRPLSGKEIRALYEAYGSDQVSSPAEIPFRQSREIQLAPYVHFGKQRLVVSADYRGSRTLMAGKPGTLQLSVVQGDKTVSKSVPAVVEGVVRPELDLGKFAPGRAQVEVVLQDSTGKRIRTGRITYEVPQIPGWIGNSLGKTDEVLPPWTPVAQDDEAVRVWGRAYNLAAPSILKGVTSQGENLLRAPVELLLGVQDRNPAHLSLSPEETFEKTPAAVAQNWMGSLSPIDAKAKTRIEYDGFMRIDLTLRCDVPMRVRSLTLRIPFTKAATLYHHANGAWNDLSDAGGIGPAGWSKRLPFVPYIWIGNERVGLAWFSEHSQDWRNSDESRAVELLRTIDGTDLILRIIDKEYTLQKPVTFTFGFMATPVRPMPKGWRDWRQAFISAINLNSYVKAGWAAENCRNIGVLWSNHVGAFCHLPTKPAEMKEKVSLLRANNWQTVLSYYALNYTQTGTTEYNLMKNEWQRHPFHQHPWASKKQLSYGSLCNASSTWGDFLLHVVDKTMDATGTDGVYLDCSNPNFCKNPQHGCDPGRYPLFAAREF